MRAVVNPFAHLLVGDLVLSSKKCLAVKLVLFVDSVRSCSEYAALRSFAVLFMILPTFDFRRHAIKDCGPSA